MLMTTCRTLFWRPTGIDRTPFTHIPSQAVHSVKRWICAMIARSLLSCEPICTSNSTQYAKPSIPNCKASRAFLVSQISHLTVRKRFVRPIDHSQLMECCLRGQEVAARLALGQGLLARHFLAGGVCYFHEDVYCG